MNLYYILADLRADDDPFYNRYRADWIWGNALAYDLEQSIHLLQDAYNTHWAWSISAAKKAPKPVNVQFLETEPPKLLWDVDWGLESPALLCWLVSHLVYSGPEISEAQKRLRLSIIKGGATTSSPNRRLEF